MNAKHLIARTLLAASVMIASTGSAHAQVADTCPCGGGQLVSSAADIATFLGGKTVCASVGGERWQEYHAVGGTLYDYKKGPSDPIDPSKVVGSWSATGSGAGSSVVYNYGSGGTYSYAVCDNGSTVNFCGARNITNATLLPGQVSCN